MEEKSRDVLSEIKLKACGLNEIFFGNGDDIPCEDDIKYAIDACEFILKGIRHLTTNTKS